MKKLFILFLALVASVGTIFASDTSVNGIWYYFDESTQTAEVTYRGSNYGSYSNEYTGSVVIPSSVTYNNVIYSVTSIGSRAFYNCSSLTSVTIPNSVTSIGSSAFYGCTGLTSPVYNNHVFAYMPPSYVGAYTIPNGIESIAGYAFSGCTGLTSVTIGNSVTSIGNFAFQRCTGLTSVTIGNSVTSIGERAFSGCTGLTSITIPNSVTSIGSYVFSGCTGLTSITIPNSVTSIGESAFWGCADLTSVTIPNSVTSIGASAFRNCTGLTSITIPNSVTSIGESAFWGCADLTSIVVASGNTTYDSRENCNAIIEISTNTLIAGCQNTIIPNSVTSIGNSAFSGCTGLTSIEIPNSVTSIGDWAFYYCTGLTSVICIGEVPPTMGDKVFFYYSDSQYGYYSPLPNFSSIYVPCGTLNTYKSSWREYANLIRYESIPHTIEAYAKNPNMGSIDYPQGNLTVCDNPAIVTAIPNRGFYFVQWADGNTDNPRTIELTQDTTMEAIFDYLLDGKCGKDSVLVWKLDTTTMALNITGNGALSENYTYGTFIESLTIGNEITTIGQSAFYRCNNLKNVTLGSSVKVLEESAFYYCSAIETITCYSQRPPTVNNYALYRLDYSTIVYVPADYLNTYKMHDTWGLYDVRPIGAKSTETTEVAVTPSETTAEVTWPAIEGAATYELVIKDKNGNTICTLVFNANGQLTQIAFNAPSRDHAPQQTQSAGFAFTVTGLEQGTGYDLTITAKDNNGSALDTQTVSFNTNWPEGIENTNDPSPMTHKILRDGQILILRGDKTYTLTGAEVK